MLRLSRRSQRTDGQLDIVIVKQQITFLTNFCVQYELHRVGIVHDYVGSQLVLQFVRATRIDWRARLSLSQRSWA
jgi:hypothetical protein